jgi:hypothetical protein
MPKFTYRGQDVDVEVIEINEAEGVVVLKWADHSITMTLAEFIALTEHKE